MSVNFAYDMWSELKRYINSVDRAEAADMLVNLLIDHDHDVDEIKNAFKKDDDVKSAMQNYFDESPDESDAEFDYDEQDNDNY